MTVSAPKNRRRFGPIEETSRQPSFPRAACARRSSNEMNSSACTCVASKITAGARPATFLATANDRKVSGSFSSDHNTLFETACRNDEIIA
jgi:hypothetical protein